MFKAFYGDDTRTMNGKQFFFDINNLGQSKTRSKIESDIFYIATNQRVAEDFEINLFPRLR